MSEEGERDSLITSQAMGEEEPQRSMTDQGKGEGNSSGDNRSVQTETFGCSLSRIISSMKGRKLKKKIKCAVLTAPLV